MNPISKKTVQKPVEVTVYEQVLETIGDGKPNQDYLLLKKDGDRSIKFLHLQANQNSRMKIGVFCSDDPEVFVLSALNLDNLLSGASYVADPRED